MRQQDYAKSKRLDKKRYGNKNSKRNQKEFLASSAEESPGAHPSKLFLISTKREETNMTQARTQDAFRKRRPVEGLEGTEGPDAKAAAGLKGPSQGKREETSLAAQRGWLPSSKRNQAQHVIDRGIWY